MTGEQHREADRLRLCRKSFELAMAEGLTMPEARDRLARKRWAEVDARLARTRCGTEMRTPTPVLDEDGGRQLQWWQK